MFTPTMFTPTPPYVGVFPLRGDVHSFKPNFLKADSLAFLWLSPFLVTGF